MQSPFYGFLVEIEDALLRMIRGVFRFTCHWLPIWIYRFFIDTVGPVTIKLVRVMILLSIWLILVFSPLASAFAFKLPSWWSYGATTWTGLSIAGSIWGLYRLAKRRKAIPVAIPYCETA